MKGRKPKPLALRVLHGEAAERAAAQAPRPRRVLPRCPEFLDGEAKACWKRTAKELFEAGLLTTIDRDALAIYCQVFARWREAEELVRKSGPVITTQSGNLIQNPYLSVANRAMEQMLKIEAEFGMTPSSRTRVKAEMKPPERIVARPATVAPEPKDDPRKALLS